MGLKEKLTEGPPAPSVPRRAKRTHPSGWEPKVEETGNEATVVTQPMEQDADHQTLLRESELDPDLWRIVGDVQVRRWQQTEDGPWLRYFKFNAKKASDFVDDGWEDVVKRMAKHKPKAPKKRPVKHARVFALSDWQCVSGETIVLDEDGAACRMKDHPEAWFTGEKDCVELKLTGGASVVATPDHRVYTKDGWKEIQELEKGEYVASFLGYRDHMPQIDHGASSDSDIGFLLGLYTSDGTGGLCGKQSMKFTNTNMDLIEAAERIAEDNFDIKPKRYPKSEGGVDLLFTAKGNRQTRRPILEWLRSFDWDSKFPRAVFSMSNAFKVGFVRGAFAGDGCFTTRGSRRQPSVELSLGIDPAYAGYWETFLASMGIGTKTHSGLMNKSTAPFMRILLNPGRENIENFVTMVGEVPGKPFPASFEEYFRKAKRVQTLNGGVFVDETGEIMEWRRAHSIEAVGVRDTYDMEVPGKHWFVAGRVKVHNCGKSEGNGTEALAERIEDFINKATAIVKDEKPDAVYLVGLGDMVEGCGNFYDMQTFSVDMDRRQQCRFVRRALMSIISAIAPHTPRVHLSCVPGNHGENRKDGKAYTSFGDNDDVATFESVVEVLQEAPAYKHVSWTIPDDDLTVTLDIAGTIITFAHGHQFKKGATPQQKALNWWMGQALGRHGAADADGLVSGHFHHLQVVSTHGRLWMQAPAQDGGSKWFSDTNGSQDVAGTLTFRVDKNGIGGIDAVTPSGALTVRQGD